MAHLRFIDPCAPRPYSDLCDMRGLGGTESTLLRISQALAPLATVTVEQSARDVPEQRGSLAFLPMALARPSGDVIVVVNSWKVALICRKRNPLARICVWQHVVPGRHNRVMAPDLARAGIDLLCVSRTHADMVANFLSRQVRVRAVFNPIADALIPDATPRDPDLLFFASSPHKGLDQVAAAFASLRDTMPSLRLELADPGYLAWDNGKMPQGIVSLGTLGHDAVIAKMRSAMCIFYPQTRFAETFGLVIAEANAVGCPALVHQGLGANDEVTSTADQRVNATYPDAILHRIRQWRQAPPAIRLKPEFRMANVLHQWTHLLSSFTQPELADPAPDLQPLHSLRPELETAP